MDLKTQGKGFIENRIDECKEIEQKLALPEFNKWLKDVGLWNDNKTSKEDKYNAWRKIHFMGDELNIYNKIHKNKFHQYKNKIIDFWFIGSSGEVDFVALDIDNFLKQMEFNFKYSSYMHLFLSVFTLGLHRKIISWLIKREEKRNYRKIKKLKQKVETWEPAIR